MVFFEATRICKMSIS